MDRLDTWQQRALAEREVVEDRKREIAELHHLLKQVQALCTGLHEESHLGTIQFAERIYHLIDRHLAPLSVHLAPQSVVAPKLAIIEGTQEVIGIVTEHFGPGVVVRVQPHPEQGPAHRPEAVQQPDLPRARVALERAWQIRVDALALTGADHDTDIALERALKSPTTETIARTIAAAKEADLWLCCDHPCRKDPRPATWCTARDCLTPLALCLTEALEALHG